MDLKKLFPIIGIGILLYIISTLDSHQITQLFSQLPLHLVILSFCIVFPLVLLTALEWQILLKKQKIALSYRYSIKNIFIGYFYGFISPGGLGAYFRAFYVKQKSKSPLPKCVSNILIFNTIDYLSLLVLGVAGALFLSSTAPTLFLIILCLLVVVVVLFTLFLHKKTAQFLLAKLLQSQLVVSIRKKVHEPLDSFFEDLPKGQNIILPFFLSLGGWILRFTLLFLLTSSFQIQVPYLTFLFSMAIANVIASLPISIYGLGTREATLISLLSVYGVPSENIVSLSLFWFIVIWLYPSIIGAVVTTREETTLQKQ